ncbi:MAG: ABC transporter ATP-binding protein [Rhizobiaceae bacterium]
MNRIYRLFERWLDPFKMSDRDTVPTTAFAFIWHFVRQAKLVFLAMLVLGGLVALMEAALFWFVGRLVDVLTAADRASGWDGLMASHGPELVGMLVLVMFARTLIIALSALVEEQVIVPGFFSFVRWQAHKRVARQSVSFFHNDFAGRLATKVWQTGQATGDFMVSLLQVIWFSIVYAISTVALVGSLHWQLAGVVVLWLVIFGLLAKRFLPRVRKAARESAEASSMVQGRLVDGYSNIQTLKLFGSQERDDAYIRDGMVQFISVMIPFTRGLSSIRISLGLTSGIMISVIAVLTVDLWIKGIVSTGGVAFTMGLVLRLNMLLGRMMTQLNSLLRNFGTIQNSMETVAKPQLVPDAPSSKAIIVRKGEIRFDDVKFQYGKGEGLFEALNLVIRAGERVGLVGRSGAGKSTLVNLLLRFYDVEGGRITVDGQNIADVKQDSLRGHIGMVTQDTSLLHRSVRENILYGRPDASDADMFEAARRSEADQFIATLADPKGRTGYDAHVGERGVKLSGGQRQRIAIARVMLKDAPILILDEATSALDSEVEAAIQDHLFELMAGKTVIAVAHRLSTIAALDRLIVLDEGKIVEDGTHSQLIANGGLYAKLWARQSGGFLGLDAAE